MRYSHRMMAGHPDGSVGRAAAGEDEVVLIERIVSGGDGMARRSDGCVVFVPRTAPRDRVEVEYTERHRQWRRARVVRVVEPSEDRCDAPCPSYERCGGCQLQHLRYPAQLEAKVGIVADCLRRLGGIDATPVDIVPSVHQFAYRNRISLVARVAGSKVTAGYRAFDNADDIVEVSACPLAEDPINAVWASLREVLRRVASTSSQDGELRLTLRASAEGRVALAVEGGGGRGWAEQLAEAAGLDAAWRLDEHGRVAARFGAEHLGERWGQWEVPLSGAAFLQVNRETAALLDSYVMGQCGDCAGRHIIDAYCGFGLRALELARRGAVVTGIDVDGTSIRTASEVAGRSATAVRFIAAAVERTLPAQLPADIVILNPPRRGVDGEVIRALATKPPPHIIYVSCNPATLARDIKALTAHFELTQCRAFDLFPQTAHVETVATLARRNAS